MKRENKADLAWGAMLTGIIAYDVFGDQTLSERFDDYLERPIGKYIAIGAVAITGMHLLNQFEHLDIPDPILAVNDAVGSVYDAITETIKERR